MKHAILLSALLACGSAWAQSSHENVLERPGSTDSGGTMGAGNVNPAPSGDPVPLAVPGAVGRGERGDTGYDFKAADSDGDGLLSAANYQRMTGSRTP